ncbi:hypothetical protein CC79DRAFT_1371725 [Sarocladium strictum]
MKVTWLSILAATALAAAQSFGTPSLTFLYHTDVTLGTSWSIGNTGFGNRVVIPITGGTFSGPRMSGTVQNLGADWGVTDTKGVFFPDTRYNLRTDDGADIYIQTSGPSQSDGTIHLRGVFETGSEKYDWLNYVVAVGVLKAGAGTVSIDMWALTSP